MNLLFFIGALGRGGMERQMCVLMDELAKRGHQIRLITFLPLDDAYKYDHRIERLRFDGGSKLSVMCRLFRYFHSQEGQSDCIIAFGRLSCEVGILTNLFHRFRFIAGERNMSVNFSRRDKFILWLFRFADGIVTNSNAQKELLGRLYPQYLGKLQCVINFTDTTLFAPVRKSSEGQQIIGVFARLHPQKNTIKLAEVLQMLLANGHNEVVVRWYGATSSDIEVEYKKEVQSYIEKSGLTSHFYLLPPVDNVPEAINECDAICLPSLFEGFSNSISEAISCGKILLASDVSDNHIMVEDGVNGFLFNPRETKTMIDAFEKYLSLSEESKQVMGRKSREKALRLFSISRFGDEYERIINEIC